MKDFDGVAVFVEDIALRRAFGARVAALRHARHLTQQELAEKLGVAVSTVSMYERGQREPSLGRLRMLTEIFGVDYNRLLGWEGAISNKHADSERR